MRSFPSAFLFLLLLSTTPIANGQNAIDLDGVNDFIATTYPGVLGNGARTVEAWIKTSANANPSNMGVQQIITDWGSFVTGGRFTFCVLWSNAIRIEVGGNGLSGTIAVNDGNWHHVAGVYNPTATNTVSLYVDGILDVTGNLTVSTNTVASINMQIGKRVDGARHFDGAIDEVRVWNVARSQSDIVANMNNEICSAPLAGLQAYYNFNEGTAGGNNPGLTNVPDWSGNNYDGFTTNLTLNGIFSNWVTGTTVTPGISFTSSTVDTCDNYFWAADSTNYTSSGVFSTMLLSSNGCDSLVELDLTINQSTSSEDTVSACQSYFWMTSGSTYVSSGTYPFVITNSVFCDSVITLHLTINTPDTVAQSETHCNSYFWAADSTTYTISGNYAATLTNSNGCDSLVQLALTIETVDTSVTVTSITGLMANQSGASYQWLDCFNGFSPVPGATSQNLTASADGSYAVQVTSGNCVDTSGCHYILGVSNDQPFSQTLVKLYPNPSPTGKVVVEFGHLQTSIRATVANALGQEIYQMDAHHANRLELNLETAAPGMYFLKLHSEDGSVRVMRFVLD